MPNYSGSWTLTQQTQGQGQSLWPVGPSAAGINRSIPGDTLAAVTMSTPSSNGTSAVTGYSAIISPGNTIIRSNTSTITFTGLSNGTSYNVTVYAFNSVAYGAPSSTSITPSKANSYIIYFDRFTGGGNPKAVGTIGYDENNFKLYVGLNSARGYPTFARLDLIDFSVDYAADANGNGYAYTSSTPAMADIIYNKATNKFIATTRSVGPNGPIIVSVTPSLGSNYSFLKVYTGGVGSKTIQVYNTLGQKFGVDVDESGNIYFVGSAGAYNYYAYSSYNSPILIKFNSNGVPQWSTADTTYNSNGYGTRGEYPYYTLTSVKVAPSGNIYAFGSYYFSTPSAVGGACLIKFDSNGNMIWQKVIQNNSYPAYFALMGATVSYNYPSPNCLAIDDSENCYVTCSWGGYYGYSDGTDAYTMKFNSSGSLQWARKMYNAVYINACEIAIDKDGNTYLHSGNHDTWKYNSSGVLQWQRSWNNTTYVLPVSYSGKIVYLLDGTICYGAYGSDSLGSDYPTYFKMPADGSMVGSYSVNGNTYTYNYGTGTDSDASSNITISNAKYTWSTPSSGGISTANAAPYANGASRTITFSSYTVSNTKVTL